MTRSIVERSDAARNMIERSFGGRLLREIAAPAFELQSLLLPYRPHQLDVDRILSAFRPQTSAFEHFMTAALQPSAASRFLEDAQNILKTLRIERVTDTGVAVDGEEISFADAEEAFEEAWTRNAALPAEERVAATSRELLAARQPSFLLVVLAYLLSTIFASPIQTITDPILVPHAQRVVKWLQTNVPSIWVATRTPDVRSVTRNQLEVRLRARRASTKVGVLYEGDQVEVLDKRKDWSLVVSVTNEHLGGWVFTRYLSRELVGPANKPRL
jgi:hypothetical protein